MAEVRGIGRRYSLVLGQAGLPETQGRSVVPARYFAPDVRGWKIGPSHYLNQDFANRWRAR